MNTKKYLNKLNRVYRKRLKYLVKNILTEKKSGLLIFIEHLKYLRDSYIITGKSSETIISLITAIEEFEANEKNSQNFHWNNFCEFIKLNMEDWLIANDSV